MAWKKPPARLVAAFDASLASLAGTPAAPELDRRTMFGCPCAFAGGKLFAGVHEETVFVRLAEGDRDELLQRPGATMFAPRGRPMRDYVVLPPAVLAFPKALRNWLERAMRHSAALPSPSRRRPARRTPRRVATRVPPRFPSSL